jgi:hypothetical protein
MTIHYLRSANHLMKVWDLMRLGLGEFFFFEANCSVREQRRLSRWGVSATHEAQDFAGTQIELESGILTSQNYGPILTSNILDFGGSTNSSAVDPSIWIPSPLVSIGQVDSVSHVPQNGHGYGGSAAFDSSVDWAAHTLLWGSDNAFQNQSVPDAVLDNEVIPNYDVFGAPTGRQDLFPDANILSPPLPGYPSNVPISSFNTLDAESIASFSGYASNNSISNSLHAVDVESQDSAALDYIPLGMQALPHAPASSTGALVAAIPAFQCHICPQSFRRSSDLTRHHSSIHHAVPGLFLCPVQGCVKSRGAGCRRRDKLTEHLWKKHGNLGFAKRV